MTLTEMRPDCPQPPSYRSTTPPYAAPLDVQDLSIGFGDEAPVVCEVSFQVMPGETLALVSQSGSGKTLTCRSVRCILPESAQRRSGRIWFGPYDDLLNLSWREARKIPGDRISMIFQEPMRSLSPLHRLRDQVAEVLRLHRNMSTSQANKTVLETFERVGFPDPRRVWRSYPFEMSGGMRQLAMIAVSMVAKPELPIADKPTTALNLTRQAQIVINTSLKQYNRIRPHHALNMCPPIP